MNRIAARDAVVAVIGMGYVGLPLARVFWDAGFTVLGVDSDPSKVELLASGRNYLSHFGEDFVKPMQAERFTATSDPDALADADAVLICLPTPLDEHLAPDLSYVDKAAAMCAKTLHAGQLIVLESSTYPGTTRERIGEVLEASQGGPDAGTSLACGNDYFLAYSPEREDPGRKDHSTRTIPKLVGGMDAMSTQVASALYAAALAEVVPVETCEVAEAAKLLENVYRAVNIALVNELKVLLTAMGVDVWKVIDAAATKPFGFQAFYPGPGLGGHCIPIDPFYLTYKAKEFGLETRFIELAGVVNRAMPDFVVERLMHALNARRQAINGSKLLILGLAYKPNVDDVRESPSFELIVRLKELGAEVDYHDPHVPATHPMRHFGDLKMRSIELTAEALAGYDGVVVSTHHDAYDWDFIAEHGRLIIDTRGALRHRYGKDDHIVPA